MIDQVSGPTRAAIYARVSTAGQENGTSLETQEASCRAYAAERGWNVVRVYREVYTGAELFDRPQLGVLRETIRKHEVDVVVAHALDRLTRNQAHLGVILSEADYAGVAVELVTERLEDTPEGRLLQSVRGYVAEIERLKIAERTMRGRKARTAKGKLLATGKAPYGYQWRDADKSALVPDPATEAILRRIYRDYANGAALRTLADRLTAENIPTATGRGKWMATTLRGMLRNPAYMGEARSWRYQCTRIKGGGWRTVERPVDEQVLLPEGTVVALVDADTWHAVQARFARNKAEAPRNNRHPEESLLRGGYVRCGYCGATAIAFVHTSGLMYRCCVSSRDVPGCRGTTILVKTLDAEIWRRVESVVQRPEVIAQQLERLQEPTTVEADIVAVKRQLATIESQRQRTARAVVALDDEEAAAPLLTELKSLAAQKRQLEADRQETENRLNVVQEQRNRLAGIAEWCARVARNLATLTYAQKRDLLTALDVRVTLYRKADDGPRWEVTMSPDEIVYANTATAIP